LDPRRISLAAAHTARDRREPCAADRAALADCGAPSRSREGGQPGGRAARGARSLERGRTAAAERAVTVSRRVILAGGSGFLGRILAADFAARGWRAVILSRAPSRGVDGDIHCERWDGCTPGAWAEQLEAADAVV